MVQMVPELAEQSSVARMLKIPDKGPETPSITACRVSAEWRKNDGTLPGLDKGKGRLLMQYFNCLVSHEVSNKTYGL